MTPTQTTSALALATQAIDTARAAATIFGVPFADVIGAIADLVIKLVGKEVLQAKIDGWDVADTQAEALAIEKLGPRPSDG